MTNKNNKTKKVLVYNVETAYNCGVITMPEWVVDGLGIKYALMVNKLEINEVWFLLSTNIPDSLPAYMKIVDVDSKIVAKYLWEDIKASLMLIFFGGGWIKWLVLFGILFCMWKLI